AARAVARGTRAAGPVLCHGLAGSIEFLLDMARDTGEGTYLAEAETLARLLRAFAVEREEGLLFSSEMPHVFSPDYLVGYAGVAACLLRVGSGGRLPHLLSREGFE